MPDTFVFNFLEFIVERLKITNKIHIYKIFQDNKNFFVDSLLKETYDDYYSNISFEEYKEKFIDLLFDDVFRTHCNTYNIIEDTTEKTNQIPPGWLQITMVNRKVVMNNGPPTPYMLNIEKQKELTTLQENDINYNMCNVIENLQNQNQYIRGIKFQRNYGKSAALQKGFEAGLYVSSNWR
jgi:hypothetical protein